MALVFVKRYVLTFAGDDCLALRNKRYCETRDTLKCDSVTYDEILRRWLRMTKRAWVVMCCVFSRNASIDEIIKSSKYHNEVQSVFQEERLP